MMERVYTGLVGAEGGGQVFVGVKEGE